MKTIRLLLHSFTLALINIAAILVGFGIYHVMRPGNQVLVQASAAAVISIAAFLLWSQLVWQLFPRGLSLQGRSELAGTLFLTLLWSPALFVPLHYLGRGYLTSWANIWNLWLFQIPVNIVALWVIWRMMRRKRTDKYRI